MGEEAALRVTVPARPESLAIVRQAVAGLGSAMDLDDSTVQDLKTVVSEAAMNVVIHAYDEDGPLEVSAYSVDDGLEVVIRDHGVGFRPRPSAPETTSLRLGLPLIAALCDGFEIRGGPGRGTELRIFMRRGQPPEPAEQAPSQPDELGTAMTIAPGAMVRPVIARVVAALAAKVDFPVDRLSEAVLLGDAVSSHRASDFAGGTVGVSIEDGSGKLSMRVGPLVEGGAQRLLDSLGLPGPEGTSLETLADEVSVRRDDDGEYVTLIVGSRTSV